MADEKKEKTAPEKGKHASTTKEIVASDAASPEKKGLSAKTKKILLIAIASIVALLLVVYAAGVYYFSKHFFPQSQFSSHDVSLESSEEFLGQLDQRLQDYTLTVSGSEFELVIATEQIALTVTDEEAAKNPCEKQAIWLWPYEVFQQHDVSNVLVSTYDQEKAHKLLSDAIATHNESASASIDATIAFDEEAEELIVQQEVYGNVIIEEALIAKADAALLSLAPTCEVTGEELVKPELYASDERFPAALEHAKQYVGGEIPITLDGSEEPIITITRSMIASWLAYDENLTPSLDAKAVEKWAKKQDKGLNSVGTECSWKRADGKECKVSGGTFGWKVDTDSLASDVVKKINSANFTAIDLKCSKKADVYNGPGKRDWGAYVDVDITQQTVRYYDANDKLLYTAKCVTGSPYGGRATPTGVYYINEVRGSTLLVGRKANGEIDYETRVNYWIPFIGSSIGLHDATWQAAFGGQRYRNGYGSHGCVNLSLSDAKWFYQNLEKGTCVITHY